MTKPSKRRRTDTINEPDINKDIEHENDTTTIVKMLNLTWNDIQHMKTAEIKSYAQAYASTKYFNLINDFYDTHSIDEQRENLTEFVIELLAENRPSTIHAESSDDFIDNLDPLMAYYEYYLAYVAESDDNEASRALLYEIPDVKQQLKIVRDNLKNYYNDAILTCGSDVDSAFEMSVDDVEENMLSMAFLEWDEVQGMEDAKIRNLLTAYSIKYEYPISEIFFVETSIDDKRELLITYVIELHTRNDSSYITARTTDREIDIMDPIWAYFEYYVIYMMDKDESDVALVLFLEIEDVRNELKSARDQLAMKKNPKDEQDGQQDVEMEYVEDVEIQLFDNAQLEIISNDDRDKKNSNYLDMIKFHKENNVTELEIDKDVMSIIGILTESDIALLTKQALCTMLQSYKRLGGENASFENL